MQAADEALVMAQLAKNTDYEIRSLAYQAWAYHLQGDLDKASRVFLDAEALMKEQNSSVLYLLSLYGIRHADHLRRRGEADYAHRVTEANLQICEGNYWLRDITKCHRLMGDLFADDGHQEKAKESFGQALDIARSISNKLVLIEALLARGRWYARNMRDSEAALSDLTEALDYARAGGYRLYEADIRIGLAWAHLAAGNREDAAKEASYAKQMSEGMGYDWGKKDAEEVLAKIAAGDHEANR